MAASKKIHLNFQGYWLDMNLDFVPNQSGVFCVYRCKYSVETESVVPTQLLYIGDAIAVRDWIKHHPGRGSWRRVLNPNEELCYTFAPIILERKRAAAALVTRHRPPENYRHGSEFILPETEILLSGRIALLQDAFTAGFGIRMVSGDHWSTQESSESAIDQSAHALIEETSLLVRERWQRGFGDHSLELVEALGGAS